MDDGTIKFEDEELLSEEVDGDLSEGNSENGEPKSSGNDEKVLDNYVSDTFLVRREATLLTLVRRGFHKRVIVFFNEKK
jgi:ATP-dependent RNA helicase DDX27